MTFPVAQRFQGMESSGRIKITSHALMNNRGTPVEAIVPSGSVRLPESEETAWHSGPQKLPRWHRLQTDAEDARCSQGGKDAGSREQAREQGWGPAKIALVAPSEQKGFRLFLCVEQRSIGAEKERLGQQLPNHTQINQLIFMFTLTSDPIVVLETVKDTMRSKDVEVEEKAS